MIVNKYDIYNVVAPDGQDFLDLKDKFLSLGIHEILSCTLASQGFDCCEGVLYPRVKNILSKGDKFFLTDLQKFFNIIKSAINSDGVVCLFGDYDVDGMLSTAIFSKFLSAYNIKHINYIPDRKMGYGTSKSKINMVMESCPGINIVIMLDCGSTALEDIEYMYELGLEHVMFVDHHDIEDSVKCCAILNPKKYPKDHQYSSLCSGALSFLVCMVMDSEMSRLMNIKDLAALAAMTTVCDIVDFSPINRAIVRLGLKALNSQGSGLCLGVQEFLNNRFDVYSAVTVDDIAFSFGPIMNAAGRIGSPLDVVNLMTTDDIFDAHNLIKKLVALNSVRQNQEAVESKHIFNQLKEKYDRNDIIFVGDEGISPGIMGIIASRIQDIHYLPTVIYSKEGNICTASCRSIKGFDIGGAIKQVRDLGLITKGGGHYMAGGMSFEVGNLEKIMEIFKSLFTPCESIDIAVDCVINDFSELGNEFIESYNNIGPFGPQFSYPTVYVKSCRIIKIKKFRRNGFEMQIADAKKNIIRVPVFVSNPKYAKLCEDIMKESACVDIILDLKLKGADSVCCFIKVMYLKFLELHYINNSKLAHEK